MKLTTSYSAFAIVLMAGTAQTAYAQAQNPFARERFTAVQERTQPEFDPAPRRVGAFEFNSELGVGALYNDNVFGQSVNPTEDVILTVRPRLDGRTTWSRNQIAFGARADVREYQDSDSESVADYGAYLSGRLDISTNFWVGGLVDGGRYSEARYAPAAVSGAAEPTRFDRLLTEINTAWRNDRFLLEGAFGRASDDFEDTPAISSTGSPLPAFDQDFRDSDETYARARASYAISPDVALFVQGRLSEIDFDAPASPTNPGRDAKRTNAQVGASFELASPWRGDIAVGFVKEEKDVQIAGSNGDFDGLSADARLQWFPTQLTTVTFSGSRTATDPGLLVGRTAVNTSGGVRVDHELRRNIILFADGRISNYDFQDIDRSDDQNELSLGAGYKINRNMRLDASYTFRNYDSSGAQGDREANGTPLGIPRSFDQNTIGLNLRLFP